MQNQFDADTSHTLAAAPAVSAEATELFIALGGVLKQLRRSPLPRSQADKDAFQGTAAPRHISTWLQIAAHGPLSITELAERMQVALATVSLVVSDLSEMALIERTTDEADRRRTCVSVTPAHRQLVSATLDHRLRPVQRTLDRLSEAERAAFIRGLVLLAEELNETRGKT
jgi:DNA-binding MarR family transcriptional regulator